MKFGKRLQSQIEETMPEWRPHFISYKKLKKSLKSLQAPVCFSEAAFEQVASPPLVGVNQKTASVVDEVDKELRRTSEAGGPASVLESPLFKLSENGVSFGENGLAVGQKSTSDDAPLESAVSNVEQVLEDAELVGHGKTEKKSEDPSGERKPKRAKLEDGTALHLSSEADFVSLLNKELNKLNVFFIEKEEEYVISLQELKYRIERVKKEQAANGGRASKSGGNEELLKILRDIVTFHGEMVLLENYSSLNYTGLVKILKKHDKVTGTVLRLPFIQSVLLQPFFTTELLSKLVRECENNLHSLFPVSPLESICSQLEQETSTQSSSASSSNTNTNTTRGLPFTPGEAVETIYRSTVVALRTMKEIRQSSTPSMFSLPPMNRIDCEEKFGVVIDERVVPPVAVAL
ncbi:hypothetical protein M758_3G184300 [Ceratodon purpureus]|nr:hypothetical protein M758_3G184300 [Ceratodon purpureus]